MYLVPLPALPLEDRPAAVAERPDEHDLTERRVSVVHCGPLEEVCVCISGQRDSANT